MSVVSKMGAVGRRQQAIERVPGESTPGRKLTRSILLVLAGLAALGALSTNIILPAFPSIGADLHVSSRSLGVTLTSFFVAFALGQLVAGPLSDRFGRRLPILLGLTLFLVGSLICAWAMDLSVLVIGRVVQGLGACVASVLSRAIARDLFDGEALARALALIMVATAAAPGFSPLLGGSLDTLIGWRGSFGVVGGLGILIAIFYADRLGETHPVDRRPAINPKHVLNTYRQLLKDRRFIVPAVSVSLILGTLYTWFSMAPEILIEGFGFSPLQLGLFFASTVFVVFLASLVAPRLATRWGQPNVGTVGMVVSLAGGGLMLSSMGEPSFTLFCVSQVTFLLGLGLVNPTLTALTLQPFGDKAGAASALLGFLQMGSATVGISTASAIRLSAPAVLAAVITAASISALLVFVLLARKTLRRHS